MESGGGCPFKYPESDWDALYFFSAFVEHGLAMYGEAKISMAALFMSESMGKEAEDASAGNSNMSKIWPFLALG